MDLERELRRGSGKAHAFLRENATARACLSWTVAREFAEGFGDIHHPACAEMLGKFDILSVSLTVAAEPISFHCDPDSTHNDTPPSP